METYPLDISAEQVVQWLIEETNANRSAFCVNASRSYTPAAVPAPGELGLGEDEREDIGDVAAIGMLEIGPPQRSEGWVMRICIQDALGPRLPADRSAPEQPEQIDLATFHEEFIRASRGTAFVSLDAETE